MSLIADALKAAQQEKRQRVPVPAGPGPGSGGFFSVRSGSRTREGMPRPVVFALVGAAAVGLVIALVTLLLSSAKPVASVTPPNPAVTEARLTTAPVSPPSAGTVAPVSAAPVLTESASPTQTGPQQPVTSTPQPTQVATGIANPPLVAPLKASTDTTRVAATDSTGFIAPAPRPPGTLKITMQDQGGVDIRPLFQQALAAQRRGDVARAKELYARALERDPRNADLYNNIGTLYRGTGELDRAEDAYRHAISLNPRLGAAWSNLGVLLDARGRRKEAIAALQQAIAIDPSNTGTKVNLALQYHAAGLYADARRLLEDAIRANPAMPEAHYALARTLEAQGDRSGAIQHYDLFLSTSGGRFPQLERQVTQHLAVLRGGT